MLPPAVSTQSRELRVAVPPGDTIKSPTIEPRAGDAIVIKTVSGAVAAPGTVRFFIYRIDGTLVGLDDPDEHTDIATVPVSPGSYYVMFSNTADVAVKMTVSTQQVRASASEADLAVERVFYATNRKRAALPSTSFVSEPATGLSYGYADVTIPRAAHEMGELEGPSIWRLEFTADPTKHIVMGPLTDESDRLFIGRVGDRVKRSLHHECLVFVHGFNVPFDDAVRRTAQIAYDLAFDGTPILFSWPSQGSMLPPNYGKDERNAALSSESLRQLLLLIGTNIPGVTIHIITHSMGGRVVASALEQLAADARVSGRKAVGQVAFLAPDIDAEHFRRVAAKLTGAAAHVTLYASNKDDALILSAQNAGYRRAGQAGRDLVVVPGMDTIDATEVETGVLGLRHLYYADNSTILSDLFQLLRGRSPGDRNARLEAVGTPPNIYWRFRRAVR
jgi:esterase/lipase superfamily enzyme